MTISCAGHLGVNSPPRSPELTRFTRNQSITFQIDISPGGHGTGVVVSKTGHLITAYHIVDVHEGLSISVVETDGTIKTYAAEVLAVDEKHDLAVIKIRRRFSQPAVLDDIRNVNPGDSIYNIGYPHNIGKYVGRGTVGRLGWTRTDFGGNHTNFHDMILADIQDGPGTSGSAVFAGRNGKVIGIYTDEIWYERSRSSVYTMFHGIQSVKHVKKLLEKIRVPYLTEFDGKPRSYPPLPKMAPELLDELPATTP